MSLEQFIQNNRSWRQQNKAKEAPQRKSAKIWTVGGGKGGVGKTLIATNLGVALARSGASVVVVDLDLGAANVHTCLGEAYDDRFPTLTDFFEGKVVNFGDLVRSTAIPQLSIITGALDQVHVANLALDQKRELLSGILGLDVDYIVLDLGAGTTFNTLDFFLQGSVGILTILPEPTSVENTYRFIKSVFYRKLDLVARELGACDIVAHLIKNQQEFKISTPAGFLKELHEQYPQFYEKLCEKTTDFHIKFVINQARTQADTELGVEISHVCRKYFGIYSDYLGCLDYDSTVWQSIKRKRPLALDFPSSSILPKIENFVGILLAEEKLKNKVGFYNGNT